MVLEDRHPEPPAQAASRQDLTTAALMQINDTDRTDRHYSVGENKLSVPKLDGGLMFKTIIAATDGSDHANKAVRIAGDLAGKYDAKLILIHILLRDQLDEGLRHYAEVEGLADSRPVSEAIANIPAARFPVSMVPEGSGGSKDSLLNSVADLILRSAEEVARGQGAKDLQTLLEDGEPARRILKAAEETGADLIVLGTRGFSDLKGLLVGSTSHKVSHMAVCPVLSVR